MYSHPKVQYFLTFHFIHFQTQKIKYISANCYQTKWSSSGQIFIEFAKVSLAGVEHLREFCEFIECTGVKKERVIIVVLE